MQEVPALGVEHDAVADQRADAPGIGLEVEPVRGRAVEGEVEGAAGLGAERSGAEGEAHPFYCTR